MHSWWVVGPVGLSAVLLRGVFGRRSTHRRGKNDEDSTREEGSLAFTCERVCTSEALLKRLGSLAKVRRRRATRFILSRGTPMLTRTAPNAGPDAKYVRDGVRHVRCAQSLQLTLRLARPAEQHRAQPPTRVRRLVNERCAPAPTR